MTYVLIYMCFCGYLKTGMAHAFCDVVGIDVQNGKQETKKH